MRCFNHKEKDAVGICKVCNKALCIDCANIYKNVVICNESCNNVYDVELYEKKIGNNVNKVALFAQKSIAVFLLILGLLSTLYSILLFISIQENSDFWGIVFLILGLPILSLGFALLLFVIKQRK